MGEASGQGHQGHWTYAQGGGGGGGGANFYTNNHQPHGDVDDDFLDEDEDVNGEYRHHHQHQYQHHHRWDGDGDVVSPGMYNITSTTTTTGHNLWGPPQQQQQQQYYDGINGVTVNTVGSSFDEGWEEQEGDHEGLGDDDEDDEMPYGQPMLIPDNKLEGNTMATTTTTTNTTTAFTGTTAVRRNVVTIPTNFTPLFV